MRRLSRLGILHAAMFLFAAALVARAAVVQLWQGDMWAARAERQHFKAAKIPAPRGDVLDAGGAPLAVSRQLVRLNVAPREVRDRAALRRSLLRAGVPDAWVRRAIDTRRRWVSLPGHYLPTDVAPAMAMRGVYGEPVSERVYTRSSGARSVVGRVDANGAAVDGLELMLDSLLSGSAGEATVLRDARGRSFESPDSPGTAARPGHTVVLTISHELQEIADRALADAVSRLGASGGDIVVLDPHDGAVLALASRRARRTTAATGLTEPFEPGSTLKPFVAAALLGRGLARPDESMETFGGTLTVNGRTITDLHRAKSLTLREVISWSSNVGIVRFGERLAERAMYETLRDLGFGVPTGAPYPSEASGTLRAPSAWSRQSAASLAMGYEIAVTPLQLALAYASIANGGELLEPALVREVRAPDGDVRFRHERRVVRRVMSEETAEIVRGMLVDVVERGTAVEADLATFAVAGKSGTARRTSGGRYARGQYTATFVGLFPAEDPQHVVLVKLDNPQGTYYGGATAAPVTRGVLEAAIAARDAALDRGALAAGARARPEMAAVGRGGGDAAPGERPVAVPAALAASSGGEDSVPYIVALNAPRAAPVPAVAARPIPDVRGMPLRGAVSTLHRAGFRVRLGVGPQGATMPALGTLAAPGSTVRLLRER